MFVKDDILFSKLMERFNVPDTLDNQLKEKIQYRTCIYIEKWIKNEGIHLNPTIKDKILFFAENQLNPEFLHFFKAQIIQALNFKPISLQPIQNSKNINLSNGPLSFEDIRDLDFAQQLTLISYSNYSKITVIYISFSFLFSFLVFTLFLFSSIMKCFKLFLQNFMIKYLLLIEKIWKIFKFMLLLCVLILFYLLILFVDELKQFKNLLQQLLFVFFIFLCVRSFF